MGLVLESFPVDRAPCFFSLSLSTYNGGHHMLPKMSALPFPSLIKCFILYIVSFLKWLMNKNKNIVSVTKPSSFENCGYASELWVCEL